MTKLETPAELVCIARAAHRQRDRELLRKVKRILLEQFGIRITFISKPDQPEGVKSDA